MKHQFSAFPLYSKESVSASQYYCSSSEHIFFFFWVTLSADTWYGTVVTGFMGMFLRLEKKHHCF